MATLPYYSRVDRQVELRNKTALGGTRSRRKFHRREFRFEAVHRTDATRSSVFNALYALYRASTRRVLELLVPG